MTQQYAINNKFRQEEGGLVAFLVMWGTKKRLSRSTRVSTAVRHLVILGHATLGNPPPPVFAAIDTVRSTVELCGSRLVLDRTKNGVMQKHGTQKKKILKTARSHGCLAYKPQHNSDPKPRNQTAPLMMWYIHTCPYIQSCSSVACESSDTLNSFVTGRQKGRWSVAVFVYDGWWLG